jgi:hypothetical protein
MPAPFESLRSTFAAENHTACLGRVKAPPTRGQALIGSPRTERKPNECASVRPSALAGCATPRACAYHGGRASPKCAPDARR